VYWTNAGLFQQNVYGYDKQIQRWVVTGTVDVGYGTQAPPAPSDNQVFFYVGVLPYYLKAVFMLTAVGSAMFADYGRSAQRQDEHDTLIKFAKFLTIIHDLILGGITKLSPPPPPWLTEPVTPLSPINPEGGFVRGIQGTFTVIPPSRTERSTVQLIDIMPIWGAVEKYSGFSSMKWPGIKVAGALINYQAVFNKLQVRVLREAMNVYAGVGLPNIWAAINNLYRFAGQPPLRPDRYSRWSFREVFGTGGVGPRVDGLLHLSDMAKFLRHTPPIDTPQTGSFSWRNLLNA
jgi:hypothetical protein